MKLVMFFHYMFLLQDGSGLVGRVTSFSSGRVSNMEGKFSLGPLQKVLSRRDRSISRIDLQCRPRAGAALFLNSYPLCFYYCV